MSYDTVLLSNNPIAFWTLQEASGTTVTDEVSSQSGSLNGSVSLGAAGPDGMGTSADFSGGHIDLGAAGRMSGPFTYEVIVWFDTLPTGGGGLVDLFTTGDTHAHIQWDARNGSSDLRVGFVVYDGAWNTAEYYFGSTVPTGQWMHFVLTYDGTTVLGYFDSVVGSQTATSGAPLATSFNTWLGDNEQAGPRPLDGRIARAAIFDYALSPSQVTDHFEGIAASAAVTGTGSLSGSGDVTVTGYVSIGSSPAAALGASAEMTTRGASNTFGEVVAEASGALAALPSIDGAAELVGSSTTIASGIDIPAGRASLKTTSWLLPLPSRIKPYTSGDLYNSTDIYQPYAGTGTLTGINLKSSQAVGHDVEFSLITPTVKTAPSLSIPQQIELEYNSTFFVDPVESIVIVRSVTESITDFEGVSTPYNSEIYNGTGVYQPNLGISPRSYITSMPSESQVIAFETDAVRFGNNIEMTFSAVDASVITVETNSNIAMVTATSTSLPTEIDGLFETRISIVEAESTSTAIEFGLKTDNRFDMQTVPSIAAGGKAFAQPLDFTGSTVLVPSTVAPTVVTWSQAQNIAVEPLVSLSVPLEITVDEDVDIYFEAGYAASVLLRIASVGNVQDSLLGKSAMGRRARAFAGAR